MLATPSPICSICIFQEKDKRASAARLLEHPLITQNTNTDEKIDRAVIAEWMKTLPNGRDIARFYLFIHQYIFVDGEDILHHQNPSFLNFFPPIKRQSNHHHIQNPGTAFPILDQKCRPPRVPGWVGGWHTSF